MKLLRKREAAARVGFHPQHLMRLVGQGKFPKPVKIGAHAIAFVEQEVSDWIKARIVERDARDRAA